MNKQIGPARACISNQGSREGEQRELAAVALSIPGHEGSTGLGKTPVPPFTPPGGGSYSSRTERRHTLMPCLASSTNTFPRQQPSLPLCLSNAGLHKDC